MKTDIRIVFHDIDGCLNPPSGESFVAGEVGHLSHEQEKTLENFNSCIENSPIEHLVLNTGRNYFDTAFISKKITTKKLKFLLLEHAAYAWDVQNQHEVDLADIATKFKDNILVKRYEELKSIQTLMAWFQKTGKELFENKYNIDLTVLEKKANLSMEMPSGCHPEDILDQLKELIQTEFPNEEFHYCYSHAFLDILGNIHKSDGAVLMCKLFNLNPIQSLVIGDGMNDLDIFEKFPNLLCPHNAHTKIIEHCNTKKGIVSEFKYAQASIDYLNTL